MICRQGHLNPLGQAYCGTCGGPITVPGEDANEGTDGRHLRRPVALAAVVVAIVVAGVAVAVLARGITHSPADHKAPDRTTRDGGTGQSTSEPPQESQAERARRLLEEQCTSQYVVPIVVRPSQLLPSTSGEGTTVYFFEIYARDTGAFISNRATWTIRGDVETYGCG